MRFRLKRVDAERLAPGWTDLASLLPGAVSEGEWLVFERAPRPREEVPSAKFQAPKKVQDPNSNLAGVGTALRLMLKELGFHVVEGCGCQSRAAEMDRRGPAWCEENIEMIVGWMLGQSSKLKAQSSKRFGAWSLELGVLASRHPAICWLAACEWVSAGRPWREVGARALVRMAIKSSKRQTPSSK